MANRPTHGFPPGSVLADTQRAKESPGAASRALGMLRNVQSPRRPILFQGTNQARRGIEAPMREAQNSPRARVIGTDALRIVLIVPEPSDGQERKQDNKDDPNINAHQSSPAAALPTNSSLTDGFYFDHLVAQAPERKPVLSSPRHCRDVAHAQTGLAQTRRFL